MLKFCFGRIRENYQIKMHIHTHTHLWFSKESKREIVKWLGRETTNSSFSQYLFPKLVPQLWHSYPHDTHDKLKVNNSLFWNFIWSLFCCSTVLQIYLIRGGHQNYYFKTVLPLLTLYLHIIGKIYKCPSFLTATTKQNRYCSCRFYTIPYLNTSFPISPPLYENTVLCSR